MLFLRSALFNALFFLATAAVAILATPLLFGPRRHMVRMTRMWSRIILWLLRACCGLRVEVLGMENVPPGACVVASKHQSAFDTVVWLSLLPDVAYVLKAELLRIPFFGWHARHARMIPVNRAGGGGALRALLRASQEALAEGRQIVIFPEGTRTAPGQRVPYLPGVVAIAAATSLPVVPVATDSGCFWGRRAFLKRPGVIRISILPPLPQGLGRAGLLAELERRIETESTRLLAGYVDKPVG